MKVTAQTVMGELVPELHPMSNFSVVYNQVYEIPNVNQTTHHHVFEESILNCHHRENLKVSAKKQLKERLDFCSGTT
jgi:hypothetical protein